MLWETLCLPFFFLCLKIAFSSSLLASSFSTTHVCSHEQAAALLQFKTSFSINSTVYNRPLCEHFYDIKANYSKTESWKEGIDCCSWDGVICDNVKGHVIALDLSCSLLSGTFPSNSTLFLLKNLQSLNLAFNDFRLSKIPPEISQFARLKHLDISSSRFSGQVPVEIAHLPKLVSLNLSDLYTWGPDPNVYYISSHKLILETTTLRNLVQNLSEVRELVLYGVNMTSVNPRCFMNLSSSLTTLELRESELRGNFPNSILRFPNLKTFCLGRLGRLGGEENLTIDLPSSNWSSPLQYLYLSVMDCGGRLPESIGDLKSLQSLSLSCNLEGPIPASIGNLSQLTSLNLYSNNLSGQIPSSLANLTQLTSLEVSNNQFSGPIPFHASRFSKLIYLDLSYNLLNGTLPPWIFTLPLLKYLFLDHNQFQGQINQFQQKSLIQLDLSNNRLQGSIPNSIANLVNLSHLHLSSNHLSDLVVADMFSALQNLESISLSQNNLSLRVNVDANFTLPKLTSFDLSSCNLSKFPNFLRHSDGLQSLLLSKSSIHGNIPKWIWEKDDLRVLDLSHNNLGGKIPNCLPKSLSVLNLKGNNFDGNIPFWFTKSCELENLNLHGNQMDGLLPRSLVNCSMLEVLDVGNNNINDTFPHWLESLQQLQVLVLRSNKFHGFVDSTKEGPSFPNLRILDLSSNYFVGALPIRYIENFNAMMDTHRDDGSPEYMRMREVSYQYSLVVIIKEYELKKILTTFTSIDLSENNFEGEIPDVIGKLSSLKGLNLSHNNLSGPISPSLGNLTNLEWLDLSSNELRGEIPDEFPNFLRHSNGLQTLVLSRNSIQGNIPEWICEKDDLEILDLSHNNLIGKIPNCLPKSLSVLNLQANFFDGNIPFGFPKGCGLRNLNLHGNQMDGLLPRSLVNCSKLEVLDVGKNNIKDTFPHWLDSVPDLQVLVLRSNKFHGSVQSTKQSPSFPKLRVLDLSNNDFVGPLPIRYVENFTAMMEPHRDHDSPEYMATGFYQYSLVVIMKGLEYELQRIFTLFTSIDLSENKFEGEIPDVFGKLSSLKGLNLSHNNLTGPISQSLGNLTNVEWLDLSSNELVGEIPDELANSSTPLEMVLMKETLDCVDSHCQNLVMEMGHSRAHSKRKMSRGDLAGELWC
ncbi:hypothetical protein SLEP1_g44623 [Rubroshorea leprosula]|uniref:Leucine-rich repeat-containing N-terminal plant-type domain-containing protein n=1 Tax=Rubroshorea leprosula TaxID=152421 RepID=A0AAV5LH46_9ROSI|nr:hypothetical protein SLEP1_g44623 [Rubroshorea leprosula]